MAREGGTEDNKNRNVKGIWDEVGMSRQRRSLQSMVSLVVYPKQGWVGLQRIFGSQAMTKRSLPAHLNDCLEYSQASDVLGAYPVRNTIAYVLQERAIVPDFYHGQGRGGSCL